MLRVFLIWLGLLALQIGDIQAAPMREYHFALANLPPLTINNNAKAEGLLVDFINVAMERIGAKAVFHFYPWPRALMNAQLGHKDGIFPLALESGRENSLYYTQEPIFNVSLHFFKGRGSDLVVNSLEEARPYLIAKVNRSYMGAAFEAMEKAGQLQVRHVSSTKLGLRALKAGRVDLFVSSKELVLFNAKQDHIAGSIVPAGHAFEIRPVYIGFSKKTVTPDFVKRVSEEISLVKQSYAYRQIVEKYFGSDAFN